MERLQPKTRSHEQTTSKALATFGPSTKQAELQSLQSYTKREYVNCLAKSIKKMVLLLLLETK